MRTLKKFFRNMETTLSATAFAEAGEFDAVRELMLEQKEDRKEKRRTDRPVKKQRSRVSAN